MENSLPVIRYLYGTREIHLADVETEAAPDLPLACFGFHDKAVSIVLHVKEQTAPFLGLQVLKAEIIHAGSIAVFAVEVVIAVSYPFRIVPATISASKPTTTPTAPKTMLRMLVSNRRRVVRKAQ